MVKRRKKAAKATERKEKVLPEPDPNSEDFMYDEVDQFHRSKDKIFLEQNKEEDEEELDESEDEEVLGLGSDSDQDSDEEVENNDYDEDEDDNNDLKESEDEEDKEKGLPSDQAWGRSKKDFYDADVDEGDIYASDEEGELAAQEEEEEALTLQKRMAARLDEEDFYTVDHEEEDSKKEEEDIVPKDLSSLSKREKLQILTKQSPDLLPLMNEYKESLKELKTYYVPLLKLSQDEKSTMTDECKIFIQTKHQLLMNYLVNISFYLAMKAKKEDLNGHPIADVLYKHRELLSQMKETHDKVITEYEEMLSNEPEETKTIENDSDDVTVVKPVQNGKVNEKEKSKKKKKQKKVKQEAKEETEEESEDEDVDPLQYYNAMKKEAEKKKEAKKKLGIQEEDEIKEEIEEYDADGKRMITYEMSKNKGLTRQKRKELRNPRVKHKMKFKKAKIKHKGQVREVRNEQNKYGGETTGIKATLSRSVRIK